jgi:hypothetical protein
VCGAGQRGEAGVGRSWGNFPRHPKVSPEYFPIVSSLSVSLSELSCVSNKGLGSGRGGRTVVPLTGGPEIGFLRVSQRLSIAHLIGITAVQRREVGTERREPSHSHIPAPA